MDEQPSNTDSSQSQPVDYTTDQSTIRVTRSLLIVTVLFSLLMGLVGGIGSVYLLSNSQQAQKTLGVGSSLSLPIKQTVSLQEGSKFIDVAKAVNPSVVSISTSKNVYDLYGQSFLQQGGGTGFVVSSDGLIATNKHVVSDTGADYTVIFSNGKSYKATVKDIDPLFDFAIVKIDATNLKAVDFGNSDDLQVGQWVVAIGNALAQFQNTVTTGVISAKERSITAGDASGGSGESLEGLLQTDAAINPGNSGGPLLNLAGQVIGVNTAVAEAQSIGFAIPSNILKPAVESVIKTGHIVRPALGVSYVPVTQSVADQQKLPVDHGAYLQPANGAKNAVIAGSSAEKAGLKTGDIITQINNQDIDTDHSLASLVQQYQVGQKITITYYRDGKQQSVDATLQQTGQ